MAIRILNELLADTLEPARAVLPLAIYLVLFTDFAQWAAGVNDGSVFKAEMVPGIPVVVLGMALFKWGLRKGLMPLGEQLGERLPDRVGEIGVCVVSFLLAIGLTLAEPAIGALQEAATLVDSDRSPRLAALFGSRTCMLLLVLAIGAGVGVAAVTGALRLLHGWDVKRMILWALVPCLVATVACSSWSLDAASVVGLAWDGGAVTTGPVTVPVVIALGIGLSNWAARARRATAQEPPRQVEMTMPGGSQGPARGPAASADAGAGEGDASPAAAGYVACGDGVAEVAAAKVSCSDAASASGAGSDEDLRGFGIVTFASLWPVLGVLLLGTLLPALTAAAETQQGGGAVALAAEAEDSAPDAHVPGWPEFTLAAQSIGPLVVGLVFLQRCVLGESLENPMESALGIFCVFLGLMLFNLGLNFGLLPLGNAAGQHMASAYEACVESGRQAKGLLLVLCFAFVGTFAAQAAEPSLNVLGETVERLTGGAFRKRFLVGVVALGVAVGTCVGVLKVLWDITMWLIIVPMYALSVVLTAYSTDGITCVAWDAGGVTTGSVTVPLILAMGLGLGKKREPAVADAFGLLGCASVFPIVTVLLAGLLLRRRGGGGGLGGDAADTTVRPLLQ